jgi:hypothetical protein
MDLAASLMAIRSTLADADAELTTVLGGHREVTQARVWKGQVLVDWEPDEQAGGCLLRPELVERLIALHAIADLRSDELRIRASGRVLASLSAAHRELVGRLGGEQHVEMRARLRFADGVYLGGEERYAMIERGLPVELLQVSATVRARPAKPVSPHTSPAPR